MTASDFIREVELKGGTAFYAQLRLPDGRRIQRRLGWAWKKRSRPPGGHLTRAQAEGRLQEILAGRDESVPLKPAPGSQATFGMAAAEWMRYIEHDRKRRPSTVQDYRRELDQRLIPEFGAETPLTEITTERVESFRERMVTEGTLSPRTINKRLQQLHSVLKRAQRVFGLQVNPVANAERQPQRRSGEFRVLAPAEVARLAVAAANEQDAALFEVAAFTGLRLGELRGLRWSDIDWVHRLIHVRRSYTRHEIGPTKSGKVRSVPLVDQAARALDELSRRERFIADEDLVFVNAVGAAIEESAMRRRFYDALKAAGLEHIRFHDLRHTFGTIAVQAFPLTDVKAFMGHADIQTTMVYVHHVPQNDAADRLSRLLEARMSEDVGCEMGAKSASGEIGADPETADLQGEGDAGGGTRTPDTRIMIEDTHGPEASHEGSQAQRDQPSSAESQEFAARPAARRKRKRRKG